MGLSSGCCILLCLRRRVHPEQLDPRTSGAPLCVVGILVECTRALNKLDLLAKCTTQARGCCVFSLILSDLDKYRRGLARRPI